MSSNHGALASLFSGQSAAYATFRPQYPDHIFQHILDFAQLERRDLVVDLGCGSGQATRQLARLFSRVVAVDANAEQLSHASLPDNVEVRQAAAETTGLPTACADLVTAATSLHWFDLPAAYREARRILKPGGALSAWTYSGMQVRWVPDSPEAERLRAALLQEVFPFFHPKLHDLLLHGYASYLPSSSDFAECRRVLSEMEVEMSVAQMVGMVHSWSAFQPYCEHHGAEAAASRLQQFQREMVAALGVADEHTPVKQIWPVDMVLARRPLALSAEGS